MREHLNKSTKLDNVCYDVQGTRSGRSGPDGLRMAIHILKLNIGNPAPFGFTCTGRSDPGYDARICPETEGYSDSKGLFSGPESDHAVLPAEEDPECGDQ